MEELVHSYLSRYYKVDSSKVGNDGIYKIEEEYPIYPIPVYGDRLIKELITIFYIDEVRLKRWINDWSKTHKINVNLSFFWKQKEPFFPLVSRVSARLLANEIVSVQPLAAPVGSLMYLDYIHEYGQPNQNSRNYELE